MSPRHFFLSAACVVASASFSCTSTAPMRTTLSDPAIQYIVPDGHYVVLRLGIFSISFPTTKWADATAS